MEFDFEFTLNSSDRQTTTLLAHSLLVSKRNGVHKMGYFPFSSVTIFGWVRLLFQYKVV